MSATFAAPVAAVLLAVELLLFEWKPRSLIPVALASATAAALRAAIFWGWDRCSRCRRIRYSSAGGIAGLRAGGHCWRARFRRC